MKRILALVLPLSLLFSCDVIDNPLKGDGNTIGTDTNTVTRKVFIEDFTGHQCKNCPDAAEAAEVIHSVYGDRVVIMAIHAGGFSNTNSNYPTDYRTTEGNDIYGFFSVFANPLGMVSRSGFSSNHLLTYGAWAGKTADLIDLAPEVKLELNTTYNASNRSLNVEVNSTALVDQNGEWKLCVFLIESNIVGPQLMPDDTRNENYVFDHVLRDGITSTFGDQLVSGAITNGTTWTNTYNYTIPANFVAENCGVIAYIYNTSNYEVIQVELEELH